MKQFLGILAVVLILVACGDDKKAQMLDRISDLETSVLNDSIRQPMNFAKLDTIIKAYEEFNAAFPKDDRVPEYHFQIGLLQYRNLNMADNALNRFEMMLAIYPDHKRAAECLFWSAYIYDNDLKIIDKAEEKYKLFLETYPEHPLSKDVDFLLTHIGMSDEQILEEILKKNAEQNI